MMIIDEIGIYRTNMIDFLSQTSSKVRQFNCEILMLDLKYKSIPGFLQDYELVLEEDASYKVYDV